MELAEIEGVLRPVAPEPDVYLALSGGGFRASAIHLGILLAYLQRGLHFRLRIVNGVSGGAIAAAYLGQFFLSANKA